MAKAKRSIANSDFVERNLEIALAKLAIASTASGRAVAVRGRESKKNAAAVKRLARRRAGLLKRRKTAKTRASRSPSAENRKTVRSAIKELTSVTKALAKARTVKKVGATELVALKAAHRRAKGYHRAIAAIDRSLRRKG